MKTKPHLKWIWLLVCLTVAMHLFAAEKGRPMNVVCIMADDLGWKDTSLYGSTFYETPHIDALARRGMMFTQAYAASPLCSPTRASILTGQFPARIGITYPLCHLEEVVLEKGLREKGPENQKVLHAQTLTRLKQEYFTLAEALKEAGYATGHFGKWHLGREPYDPLGQGFDVDIPHWYGYGPPGSYLAPWNMTPKMTIQQGTQGDHIEDRIADSAIEFIQQNKDRAFFVNYWAFSVHDPHQAKPELEEKYKAKAHPDCPQRQPVNAAMIETLDTNIGRLLETLDREGLRDHTIVIFLSDNGGIHWPSRQGYKDIPVTSNAPLKGGKATLYEGGTREPLVVVWPGVVKPNTKTDSMVSSVDFYPTILEMLDIAPQPDQKFDGASFVPVLKGQGRSDDTLFCHFPHDLRVPLGRPGSYVRKGNWKLIRFYCDNEDRTDRLELYNLAEDIGETKNLAKEYPDKVSALSRLLDEYLDDTDAVIPLPNPTYQPKP